MEELYGRGYVRKGSNPDRPAKWVVAGLEGEFHSSIFDAPFAFLFGFHLIPIF